MKTDDISTNDILGSRALSSRFKPSVRTAGPPSYRPLPRQRDRLEPPWPDPYTGSSGAGVGGQAPDAGRQDTTDAPVGIATSSVFRTSPSLSLLGLTQK